MNNDRYSDYDSANVPQRRHRQRNNNAQKPKKKKISPVRRFFTIFICVAAVYFAALGAFALVAHFTDDPDDKPIDVLNNVLGIKLPERTNFVLMCTDEDGTRTDTIMVGCYNSILNSIDLISIPRDTLVSVSSVHFEMMQEEYPYTDSPEMQINHIHHFIGKEKGPQILTEELETLLDIDIDYYARVDFDAFKYFVDSVGGIEFDVPRNMDYDDPSQDLAIHLTPGIQMLDGDKAEQLVRYRKDNNGGGYANGDIGRIEVQQNFLKALIKKAVSSSTITSSPKAYITTFIKYITTNASLGDALKYTSKISELNTDNINTYTLPGEARNRYYYDPEETKKLVYDVFKRPSSEISTEGTPEGQQSEETEDTISSKSCSIQVLNGGYTDGKAAQVKETLESNGYTVTDIGTYTDVRQPHTRIFVNKEGLGEDLKSYFANAEIIYDSDITGNYDIVIVIGVDE